MIQNKFEADVVCRLLLSDSCEFSGAIRVR